MTLVLLGQAAYQEGSPYTFLGFGNKVLPVPLPGRVQEGAASPSCYDSSGLLQSSMEKGVRHRHDLGS